MTEALTNVAKHAGSDRAGVKLAVADAALLIVVRDGGTANVGLPWAPGVGLSSMRERALQLGGTCEAAAAESGGLVTVRLPIA